MLHVSRDYIQAVWNETQDKNWLDFQRTIEHNMNQAELIDRDSLMMMIHMAEDMDNSGEPFPHSVDELHNVINENLGIEREREF